MRNIQFPAWFYEPAPVNRRPSVSPAAAFDPACAISGDGWLASTTPAAQRKPRMLIITKESVEGFSRGELFALLRYLQESINAMMIFYRHATANIANGVFFTFELLLELGLFSFDNHTYSQAIAVSGKTRDQLVWLDSAKMHELFACVNTHHQFLDGLSCWGNDYQVTLEGFSEHVDEFNRKVQLIKGDFNILEENSGTILENLIRVTCFQGEDFSTALVENEKLCGIYGISAIIKAIQRVLHLEPGKHVFSNQCRSIRPLVMALCNNAEFIQNFSTEDIAFFYSLAPDVVVAMLKRSPKAKCLLNGKKHTIFNEIDYYRLFGFVFEVENSEQAQQQCNRTCQFNYDVNHWRSSLEALEESINDTNEYGRYLRRIIFFHYPDLKKLVSNRCWINLEDPLIYQKILSNAEEAKNFFPNAKGLIKNLHDDYHDLLQSNEAHLITVIITLCQQSHYRQLITCNQYQHFIQETIDVVESVPHKVIHDKINDVLQVLLSSLIEDYPNQCLLVLKKIVPQKEYSSFESYFTSGRRGAPDFFYTDRPDWHFVLMSACFILNPRRQVHQNHLYQYWLQYHTEAPHCYFRFFIQLFLNDNPHVHQLSPRLIINLLYDFPETISVLKKSNVLSTCFIQNTISPYHLKLKFSSQCRMLDIDYGDFDDLIRTQINGHALLNFKNVCAITIEDFTYDVTMENNLIKELTEMLQHFFQPSRPLFILVPHYLLEKLKNAVSQLPHYNEELHQFFANTKASPVSIQNKPPEMIAGCSKKLFIHNKSTEDRVISNVQTSHSTYTMVFAGEVLSGDCIHEPRVRTAVLDYHYDDRSQSLQRSVVKPRLTSTHRVPWKKTDFINQCREQQDEYYYFQFTQTLSPGEPTRLFSIYPSFDDEKLCGVIANNRRDLQLFPGGDGFYYAIVQNEQTITYVLAVKRICLDQSQMFYAKIPNGYPPKQIIEFYRQEAYGFRWIAENNQLLPMPQEKGFFYWINFLFLHRAGVCWHRACIVAEKIKESGFKDCVRVVHIDNNHEQLEIFYHREWVPVELGGGNDVTLEYQKTESDEASLAVVAQSDMEERTETGSVSDQSDVSEPNTETVNGNDNDVIVGKVNASEMSYSVSPNGLSESVNHSQTSEATSTPVAAVTPQRFFSAVAGLIDESRAFRAMKNLLLPQKSIEKCRSLDDFFAVLFKNKLKRLCVVTQKIDLLVNTILEAYQNNRASHCCFYLDNPDEVALEKEMLLLSRSEPAKMTNQTLLLSFLRQSEASSNSLPRILIINRSRMTHFTAMNSCFDSKRREILGKPIPEDMIVLILSNKEVKSDDPSFLSRQEKILSLTSNILHPPFDFSKSCNETFDLQGHQDWKKALFGRVFLKCNQIFWKRSDFVMNCDEVQEMENGVTVTLLHFPENAREEIQYFINQSKAKGYFDYHGCSIPFPKNLTVTLGENHYDFSQFDHDRVEIFLNATVLSKKDKLLFFVNTYDFDKLLYEKTIKDGQYIDEQGLIEWWAADEQADQPLQLFITTELAESQWWCLLDIAQKNNVSLCLFLAPGVYAPMALNQRVSELENVSLVSAIAVKPVIITNTPNAFVEKNNILVLDVEDYTFQDLFYCITYKKQDGEFSDFMECRSDVLQQLIDGQDVILKGEFAPDLLAYLHTALLPYRPYLDIHCQRVYLKGRLQLIIENKNLQPNSTDNQFAWLSSGYVAWHYVNCLPQPISPTVFYSDMNTAYSDIDFSKTIAKKFMDDRKQALFDALQNNAMVQLVGHTGVGKSQLMKMLKTEEQKVCEIYRELDDFEKWATDKNNKIKILFIDESNIDNLHYTLFSPLKSGGSRRILHKGKLYQLGEKHRVVFARNPGDYGGGRVEQKLFADSSIPELRFSNFPPAYIFHDILKPIFDSAKIDVSQANFEKDCALFIATNRFRSVRELQQFVLSYCARHKDRKTHYQFKSLFAKSIHSQQPSDFVITKSIQPVYESLTEFFIIKKLQHSGKLLSGVGLNGVLLSGSPGVGKSELTHHVLTYFGLPYVKISPAMDFENRKKSLLAAAQAGKGVWIDEINVCMNDGFEKIFNEVLTHASPGFFFIGTANGVDLEERSRLSPAVRDRCLLLTLTKPTKTDVQKIAETRCDDDVNAALLGEHYERLQSEHFVTLRSLCDSLPDLVGAYRLNSPSAKNFVSIR